MFPLYRRNRRPQRAPPPAAPASEKAAPPQTPPPPAPESAGQKGQKMEAAGQKMEAAGQKMEAAGQKMEAAGRKMESAGQQSLAKVVAEAAPAAESETQQKPEVAPPPFFQVLETMPQLPTLRAPHVLFLVTRKPDTIWCDFLSTFQMLQPIVVVDDNTKDLAEWRRRYNLTFLQLNNKLCEERGYTEMNHIMMRKRVTAWEKAMLLAHQLAKENPQLLEHAWFVEDDVYFLNEATLLEITERHDDEDLLCNSVYMHSPSMGSKETWGHWKNIQPAFPAPYYHGMMCAVRLSRVMIAAIAEYAAENRKLFFLEALFPSLAMHHRLRIATPDAFRRISWNTPVEASQIDAVSLFHPVKDMQQHVMFRQMSSADIN